MAMLLLSQSQQDSVLSPLTILHWSFHLGVGRNRAVGRPIAPSTTVVSSTSRPPLSPMGSTTTTVVHKPGLFGNIRGFMSRHRPFGHKTVKTTTVAPVRRM